MRVYKPEGATHYGGLRTDKTIWYKHASDGLWYVWWPRTARWEAICTPAVAVRPILVDTGANQ